MNEVTLWSFKTYFHNESGLKTEQSKKFAYKEADLQPGDYSEEYWNYMARYISSGYARGGYNESIVIEAKRQYPDDEVQQTNYVQSHILPENVNWDWKVKDQMNRYSRMQKDSGLLEDNAKVLAGTIIVNHVISAFHALITTNKKNNLQVHVQLNRDMKPLLQMNYQF